MTYGPLNPLDGPLPLRLKYIWSAATKSSVSVVYANLSTEIAGKVGMGRPAFITKTVSVSHMSLSNNQVAGYKRVRIPRGKMDRYHGVTWWLADADGEATKFTSTVWVSIKSQVSERASDMTRINPTVLLTQQNQSIKPDRRSFLTGIPIFLSFLPFIRKET